MFETSRPNGRGDRAITPAPSTGRSANSLTTDFSRLIPNQTDVAVLKERPWTILNFAIIGNETRYHSPDDNLAALDPRSLRHMGEQALQVTADLAGGAAAPAGGELLYGDVLGIGLVTLPLWLGLALLGALLLGFVWLAWSRRGGVGRGVGGARPGHGRRGSDRLPPPLADRPGCAPANIGAPIPNGSRWRSTRRRWRRRPWPCCGSPGRWPATGFGSPSGWSS